MYVYINIAICLTERGKGDWRRKGVRRWTKERARGDVLPKSWVHCHYDPTPYGAFQAKFGEHGCGVYTRVLLDLYARI